MRVWSEAIAVHQSIGLVPGLTTLHQPSAMRPSLVASVALLFASVVHAQQPARAIEVDPQRDSLHPARSEVLHVPSGGVKINGLAYVAEGPGAHPTLVMLHGLPGNEKNLDLAQAVRRAGWNAVTFNYRGSWGSPGSFRFGNTFEDADAVLAFLRDTANARKLGVDPRRIAIAGHSMGGWTAALTAAHDHALLGAVLISLADMGGQVGGMPRSALIPFMADDMESLAGVTAESMADDLLAGAARWRVTDGAPGLASVPLLVLTANDGLAPHSDALVKAVRARGNARVTTMHANTDHSWSNERIALQNEIIPWLRKLDERARSAQR